MRGAHPSLAVHAEDSHGRERERHDAKLRAHPPPCHSRASCSQWNRTNPPRHNGTAHQRTAHASHATTRHVRWHGVARAWAAPGSTTMSVPDIA
eukprot:498646-Rhodomonas_salina.4